MEKKEAEAGKKSVTVERTKGVMMQNKAEGVGWGPKRGEETTARWPQVVVKTRSHVRTEKRREEKRSKRRRWKGSRERGREGGWKERTSGSLMMKPCLSLFVCISSTYPFCCNPLPLLRLVTLRVTTILRLWSSFRFIAFGWKKGVAVGRLLSLSLSSSL